jgi:hypothetical protein
MFDLMMLSFVDIIELLVFDEWNMSMKYGQAGTVRGKPKYPKWKGLGWHSSG